jgi:hypothetical protein
MTGAERARCMPDGVVNRGGQRSLPDKLGRDRSGKKQAGRGARRPSEQSVTLPRRFRPSVVSASLRSGSACHRRQPGSEKSRPQ